MKNAVPCFLQGDRIFVLFFGADCPKAGGLFAGCACGALRRLQAMAFLLGNFIDPFYVFLNF